MPITVCESESSIVRFTLSGRYTFEDVLEVVATSTAGRPPETPSLGLLDIRKSEEIRSPEQLRILARQLGISRVFGAVAVLAERAVHYGLARMLSVFAEREGLRLEAFRAECDALEWLHST